MHGYTVDKYATGMLPVESYPCTTTLDTLLSKIEASAQRFFNHGSSHVKIPMKKYHFLALLLGL